LIFAFFESMFRKVFMTLVIVWHLQEMSSSYYSAFL
jgi:hypothetical protein